MSETRLRLLLSRYQNAFFKELAEVIVDEVCRLGGRAEVVDERVICEPEDIFVLLPTHEYIALEGTDHLRHSSIAARTIGVTAEQPTSGHFRTNVNAGKMLGAVFDFSRYAVDAYESFGVTAHHLPFGWSPSWDRFDADADRTGPDVLFMGSSTDRRARQLSKVSRAVWQRRSKIIISDNSRPNHQASTSFLVGEAKRDLLAQTKILLNVHQTDEPYFEWLRVSEAMMCGAVVLTEPSIFIEPFVDDVHLVVRTASAMADAVDELLADHSVTRSLRVTAYELLLSQPFSRSVAQLLDVADALRRRTESPRGSVGPVRATPFRALGSTNSRPRNREEADVVRQALRELRLDVMDLRRRVETSRRDGSPASAEPEMVAVSAAEHLAVGPPLISVCVALYNHSRYLTSALSSVANCGCKDIEIVVVDDGSTDDSLQVARAWTVANPDIRARVIASPVNRGLPRARNTAVEHATGEFCFILDADNEVLPGGLDALLEALDRDPEASFAYGLLETFGTHGPEGLMGQFPWDVDRLAHGNYIDAMALIRRPVLVGVAGYTTDRRLYGWEDYDLWCRIAEGGGYGVHIPTIVARYRLAMSSMVSLSNLSHDAAFDALYDHAPRVMSRTVITGSRPIGDAGSALP